MTGLSFVRTVGQEKNKEEVEEEEEEGKSGVEGKERSEGVKKRREEEE